MPTARLLALSLKRALLALMLACSLPFSLALIEALPAAVAA